MVVPGIRVELVFPRDRDLVTLVRIWKEYYRRHFPAVIYMSLRLSEIQRDPYGQVIPSKRIYDEFLVHVIWTENPSNKTIDEIAAEDAEKTFSFRLLISECEDLGLDPKSGDRIIYPHKGVQTEWEVRKVSTFDDSFYAKSNYFFEYELIAERPRGGQ